MKRMWTYKRYNRNFNVSDDVFCNAEAPETEKYWKGYMTITNGHLTFDIHPTIDGAGSLGNTPLREPGPKRWIVSPDEAEAYGFKLLNMLRNQDEI